MNEVSNQGQEGAFGEGPDDLLFVDGLTISYERAPEPALHHVSFAVSCGSFTLVVGPSGSGLSTLAEFVTGLIPELVEADVSGNARICGLDYASSPIAQISQHVGMVFQNPREQVFCQKVEDEVSFAVENKGLPQTELVAVVDKTMELLEVEQFRDRAVYSLSGGQLQRAVIASVVARQTDLIVLDEPTADLDPVSTREVLDAIAEIRASRKMSIMLFEHAITEIISQIDHLIVLDKTGGMLFESHEPIAFVSNHWRELADLGIRVPEQLLWADYLRGLGYDILDPFDVDVLAASLAQALTKNGMPLESDGDELQGGDALHERASSGLTETTVPKLAVRDLRFAYKGANLALKGISVKFEPGTVNAVLGQNGSGKSTFLKLLSKLLDKTAGSIELDGKDIDGIEAGEYATTVGIVFQNPDTQLFKPTVFEEVAFGLQQRGLDEAEIERRVEATLDSLGLSGTRDQHPFSLSRGARQRLALATVLVAEPDVILFDEPTTGQDTRTLAVLVKILRKLEGSSKRTIVMVTHDMDLAAEVADNIVVFDDGLIRISGNSLEVFTQSIGELQSCHLVPPVKYRIAARIAQEMGCGAGRAYQIISDIDFE